jgi:hypothetical protein
MMSAKGWPAVGAAGSQTSEKNVRYAIANRVSVNGQDHQPLRGFLRQEIGHLEAELDRFLERANKWQQEAPILVPLAARLWRVKRSLQDRLKRFDA